MEGFRMSGNDIANLMGLILPMAAIFGLMYVMVILPQKRRDKKQRELINSIQVGTNIVTVGGVMGKVINIKDDEITIESGVERTKIKIQRWAIKDVEKLLQA
jgi:preprotein translocase subunit YajC